MNIQAKYIETIYQDPASDDSPFYNKNGGLMKPLAVIKIQKMRDYRKSCNEGDDGGVSFTSSFDRFGDISNFKHMHK